MTSVEKNTKKTVKLNVGGVYFKTSLLTLTKDPDSMLAAMFSSRFEENLDELMKMAHSSLTGMEISSGKLNGSV